MKKGMWMILIVSITAMGTNALLAQSSEGTDIFAQKLVDQTMAKHPEVKVMGIHSTAPNGSNTMSIIACSTKSKVGKKSDPDDIEVMQTGKSSAEERPKKEIYDLGLPLLDQQGEIIGMVVLEIKFSYAKSKESALDRGKQIQAELQKDIPSKAKLFELVQ